MTTDLAALFALHTLLGLAALCGRLLRGANPNHSPRGN